jgi:hypothetical protein
VTAPGLWHCIEPLHIWLKHPTATDVHVMVLGSPAGPLTVDLQGCSKERGLVIVVAWLSRAALLPQDRVPDAQIIFGMHVLAPFTMHDSSHTATNLSEAHNEGSESVDLHMLYTRWMRVLSDSRVVISQGGAGVRQSCMRWSRHCCAVRQHCCRMGWPLRCRLCCRHWRSRPPPPRRMAASCSFLLLS